MPAIETPEKQPAEATKPLDRNKPFARIHNEAFIVTQRPDGVALKCGCHQQKDLGSFREVILKAAIEEGWLGELVKALDKFHDIVQTLKDAVLGAVIVLILLGVGPGILGAVEILDAYESLLDTVVEIAEEAIKNFLIEFAKLLIDRAVRVIPQWVPVTSGARDDIVTKDQIKEVEGLVTRSYGNPIEAPLWQWHRWYNWSVQLRLDEPYKKTTSPSPLPSGIKGITLDEHPVSEAGSFELQWDTGALWDPAGPDSAAIKSGFPEHEIPAHDGPMMFDDWAWPLAGSHVWAAGRFVYDCSQTSDEKENPRMCSLFNPCKALATARWTAVRFKENERSTPAIQFMFLASTRGGYIRHESLNDQDYEFILDLPPIDVAVHPFAIGHTPDFPHNTIVLRPRLLKDLRKLALAGCTDIEPIIEPIRPDDPAKAPSQVKITIPLTKLDGKAQACGFVLSLGWFDPNLDQAKKVKHCTLTVQEFSGRKGTRDSAVGTVRSRFKQEQEIIKKTISDIIENIALFRIPGTDKKLTIGDIPLLRKWVEDLVDAIFGAFLDLLADFLPSREEWLLRVGVNGVWKSQYFPDVGSDPIQFNPPLKYEFSLGEEDALSLSVHGIEFNPVGDFMRTGEVNRTLLVNNVPVPWPSIVHPDSDPEKAKDKWLAMVREYVHKLTPTLGLENAPLGIIDPTLTPGNNIEFSNPLLVNKLNGTNRVIEKTAKLARALEPSAVLVEAITTDDYTLKYRLQIDDQKLT